jgi:rubrerythrin
MMTAETTRVGDPVAMWAVAEGVLPVGLASEPSARSPLERLQDTFAAHTVAETETIAAYQRLAETSPDPVVALLMQLVSDDEARHHGLLSRMLARLRATLTWTAEADALPTGTEGAASPDELVALQAYVRQEEEGARQLRRIAADEKQLCGGLFALLLETMAIDSQKHAHILRYLLHRARQQAG